MMDSVILQLILMGVAMQPVVSHVLVLVWETYVILPYLLVRRIVLREAQFVGMMAVEVLVLPVVLLTRGVALWGLV